MSYFQQIRKNHYWASKFNINSGEWNYVGKLTIP